MDIDSIVVRSDRVMSSELGEDLILMDREDGRFFSLSGTGRAIWGHLAEPIAVAALVDALLGDFAVERARCERETLALCRDLHHRAMIDVV